MNMGRIVDLSQKMVPGKEHFKLEAKVSDVTEIMPHIKHRKDVWYVLGEVNMCSHVGTHIEFPYHHVKEGDDAAAFPVDRLIGEGVVLNFTHKKADKINPPPITLEELKAHDEKIKKGDIVLIRTDCDKFWHTEQWENYVYITMEGIEWLVEKGIHCIGTDSIGMEVPGTDHQPAHTLLFKHGIPMIESMTNLGQLKKERFLIFILPLPIVGLDASPVRIIAIEE